MRLSTVLLSFVVIVAGVGVARADVAPPDVCTAPGQPCQNAGAQFNQPGTCLAATCTKVLPAADGGVMSISYACNHCQATGAGGDGGAAGANGGGAGGNPATGGVTGTGGTPATGGVTGTGGTPAAGGTTGTGGSSTSPGTGGTTHAGGGSSGCSVAPGWSADDLSGALAVLIALALTVVVRRRHATT